MAITRFWQLVSWLIIVSTYLNCSGSSYFDSRSFDDIRPLELYNVAVNKQRQGDFLGAIEVYEEALTMFPGFPEANQNLGHLYETQNNLEKARFHHLVSIQHASSEEFNASAIVNLVLLDLRNMPVKTIALLQPLSQLLLEAESLYPKSSNVLFTHAQVHEHMGDLKTCARYLQRVLAVDDRHTLAWLNLGNQFFKANNFESATKFYKNALDRLRGDDVYNRVLILNNLGQGYRERGMLQMAYDSFYSALLVLSTPNSSNSSSSTYNSYNNGNSRNSLSDLEGAVSENGVFNGGTYNGKAIHFWCLNNLYTLQGLRCDWKDFELLENKLERFITPPGLLSASSEYNIASFKAEGVQLDAYTMSLLSFASRSMDKFVCELSCPVRPIYQKYEYKYNISNNNRNGNSSGYGNGRSGHRNGYVVGTDSSSRTTSGLNHFNSSALLKVAYLSHDWRDHPMGRLTATLIVGHNRNDVMLSTYRKDEYSSYSGVSTTAVPSPRARVSATAISYGANDHSEVRQFVETYSGDFVDVFDVRNDMELSELIYSRQFDVLVDITAHTYNGRIEIAAVKPSPVVINYLGFPGTTGCAGFDYSMVTANIVPPEIASELFTEKMIYLPHTYQSNDMPLRVSPRVCTVRANQKDAHLCRKRGKLVRFPHNTDTEHDEVPKVPENALLVCSFNANKKMEPSSVRAWMSVLQRVPVAFLVLLSVGADVKAHLLEQAAYAGVHPKRIVFVPKREWKSHLLRSSECDIVLDTFIYGAHTTASDVLWMGVPLLSLAAYGSQRMPSRVASSITQSLSLPRQCASHLSDFVIPAHILVTHTVQEYENTAVMLLRAAATTRYALSDIISHSAGTSAAFDSELVQVNTERAYQLAHEIKGLHSMSLLPAGMPHIVLVDRNENVMTEALCRKTWENKFRRDLSDCCGRSLHEIDVIFTLLHQNNTAIDNTYNIHALMTEFIRKCRLKDLLQQQPYNNNRYTNKIENKNKTQDNNSSVCSVEDLEGVLRRLVMAYPDMLHSLYPEISELTISPEIESPPEKQKDAFVSSNTERNDACKEYLNISSALAFLSNAQVSPEQACTVSFFPTALQGCYLENAPETMDFILQLQGMIYSNGWVVAGDVLYEIIMDIAFERISPIEWIDVKLAEVNLRKLGSAVTYVSPRWRTIAEQELRDVIAGALLAQQAHKALPRDAYLNELQRLHLLLFQPTKKGNENMTVCNGLFNHHNLYLSLEQAAYKCRVIISRQLSVFLSEHALNTNHNEVHAMVLDNTVFSMLAAFVLEPTNQRLLNLGTLLMDRKESEIGFFLSSVAVLRMAKSLPFPDEVDKKVLNFGASDSDHSQLPRIIFYCDEYGQGWWPGWGPSSLIRAQNETSARGMGGSEEAVYYTAQELARRGYEVIVYAGVTEKDHGLVQCYNPTVGEADTTITGERRSKRHGSVTWLHYDTYHISSDGMESDNCEVFIAWRYAISLALTQSYPRAPHASGTDSSACGGKYLWLHDLIPANILPPSYFSHFNGIFVQSEFHQQYIAQGFRSELQTEPTESNTVTEGIHVVPNGLILSQDMDGVNDKNVFIYASSPSRGLAFVLSQWRKIKEQIPDAVLEIYYGFTDSVLKDLRQSLGESFEAWYAQIQTYLQQDGVRYIGAVDHEMLTRASSRAGFLLYPTAFPETGCITVLRAMACGAIPITSRLYPSVLHTLTHTYDMGPLTPLNRTTAANPVYLQEWLASEWTPAVIEAYNTKATVLQERRHRMKRDIRNGFSWAHTADKLIQIISG